MQIKFKSLSLQNFKSHRDLQVNFGEVTQIIGDNAQGKTSILEGIIWTLYGTDLLGSTKFSPVPTTYESESTIALLLLNVDGKDLLLGRELKKGKAKYYINEVPSKAGEFNEILNQMFDKDLFLSLFNPSYFFTLHPTNGQRPMIMRFVTKPANKEVLKDLPEIQSSKLAELVKKHSLGQLENIHRENKTKLDKQYIAAGSRTKTLKEQLEDQTPSVPLESLKVEVSELVKQRNEIEKVTDTAGSTNGRINVLQNRINTLVNERAQMQEEWAILKNEQITDTCRTCKQPLQDEAIQSVQADKEERMKQFKANFQKVVDERKELEAELATLEYIDVSEQMEKARELQEKINPIEYEISKHKQLEALQKQVNEAIENENETLKNLNESIFILDSIKDFRAKEAELQAEKVQSLFDNLSIKLFEILKNGEIKPTFEVMMDGKEYKKLSLSEGIRAGLELRDVLSQQSEIIVPCFVDNAESITKFKEPNGQLIISRVVADQELKVESQ